MYIPGWGYNFMIEQADKQRRDVKAELSLLLERAIRKLMQDEGQEPGNSLELQNAA